MSQIMLWLLLLSKCEKELVFILVFIIHIEPNVFHLSCKFSKIISRVIPGTLTFSMFSMSLTPATCTLCLIMFRIWCHTYVKPVPHWLPIILIILSDDVHLNPGPQFQNNFFNFMSWNVNSLAKENFQRVRLIEAHNSIFNYDLISICETSLDDTVELHETLLNGYTFVSANNPANNRHGGVGLFYKKSLPALVRDDLSFEESIVVELKFGRKKIFFTVLYRTPAFKHTSPEFQAFLTNFENLYSNIKTENPFAIFFTTVFNDAHSQFWWPDGDTTPEGTEIEELITKLGLSQLISEPTNFEPHKNPSCIDLVITDQPNVILDSGTRASLDSYCPHQIVHCEVNFRIPPFPFERTIRHFNRANSTAIKRSMVSFPWRQHLNINTNPNWKVKTFTDTFLNIMSYKMKPKDLFLVIRLG